MKLARIAWVDRIVAPPQKLKRIKSASPNRTHKMEFKKYKLADVAEIFSGYPFPGGKYREDGFLRVIRGENVSIGKLRWDSEKFWGKSAEGLDDYLLKEGDIVIGMDGSRVGQNRAMIKKEDLPLILAQRVACLRAKEKFSQDFLWCIIFSDVFKNYVNVIHTGSSVPHISQAQIEDFEFPFPPLEEQKKIAGMLALIDRKIELCEAQNRTLEKLARQIYDYWFVQFDFPDENGKPYKSSGGKMVYNEKLKREIPDGWEVARLGSVLAKIDSGKRPRGGIDKSLRLGIPSLGAECIDSLGVFDFKKTPYLPISFKQSLSSGIIESGDILIYKDGAYVGKTTLFRDGFPFAFAAVNEHVFLIKAHDKRLQEYLFFTLNQVSYFETMQRLGKAKAAQPGLNQDDLKELQIIHPPSSTTSLFHEKINALFASIFSNAKQRKNLEELRERLLPLLMNGQVEVCD